MSKKQKLELTWIGKEKTPKLEAAHFAGRSGEVLPCRRALQLPGLSSLWIPGADTRTISVSRTPFLSNI